MDELAALASGKRGNHVVQDREALVDEAALGQQLVPVVTLLLAPGQVDEHGPRVLQNLVVVFSLAKSGWLPCVIGTPLMFDILDISFTLKDMMVCDREDWWFMKVSLMCFRLLALSRSFITSMRSSVCFAKRFSKNKPRNPPTYHHLLVGCFSKVQGFQSFLQSPFDFLPRVVVLVQKVVNLFPVDFEKGVLEGKRHVFHFFQRFDFFEEALEVPRDDSQLARFFGPLFLLGLRQRLGLWLSSEAVQEPVGFRFSEGLHAASRGSHGARLFEALVVFFRLGQGPHFLAQKRFILFAEKSEGLPRGRLSIQKHAVIYLSIRAKGLLTPLTEF